MIERLIIVAAIMLAACRGPDVLIEDADAASAEAVAYLIESVAVLGDPVVQRGAPGVHVLTDAEWITDYNRAHKSCAWAVQQGNVIVLSAPDAWSVCVAERKDGTLNETTFRPTPETVRMLLAHELAHAAGIIEHRESGLMAHYDKSCLHRIPECLIEVLQWR